MLNIAARRVAVVVTVLGIALATGACGARPNTRLGEPVILAAPKPSAAPPADPTTPAVTTTTEARPTQSPGDLPPLPIDPAPVLAAAANAEPNTTLGAVVFDRNSGQTLLAIEPDRQFRSASLVKLMIAIDALRRGKAQRSTVARMLSVSDDNIASTLWVRGGGANIITRTRELIGLQSTEPPEVAGKWGEVKLTANDMLRVYQFVMNSLSAEDNTLIVDALAQAPQYAADGWDQYFGIPDGLTYERAIKQGWGNNGHAMVLHSTGLVGAKWRYVVILLTEHPLGSGWRTSERSVTAAAEALAGRLPGA